MTIMVIMVMLMMVMMMIMIMMVMMRDDNNGNDDENNYNDNHNDKDADNKNNDDGDNNNNDKCGYKDDDYDDYDNDDNEDDITCLGIIVMVMLTKDHVDGGSDDNIDGDDNDDVIGVMRMNMMLLAVNSSMILFGTPVIFSPLPDVDAYENKTITLQCQAIGDAVISIAWLHNDTLVQNRSVNTALVISKIPLNMSGSWRCVASNHLGSQNKTFFVGVKKPSDLCVRFNTLSDATRFHSYKTTSTAQSDAFLNRTDWYAFKSPTGYYQLLTSCAPANRCNAVATGWLRGKHPTTADGVVTRTVCFHRNGDCCHSSVKVQVRNCVNQYVYKLVPPDEPLTARYCTEDHVEEADPTHNRLFQLYPVPARLQPSHVLDQPQCGGQGMPDVQHNR
ncbi:uncharacterized protein LOC5507112 isoform X2 [Nematostella vectensis]|uniref:uncharacterized protein LOC5507112 isoform X2 n=1 Tax=Nematostella vectensis TaxID=45351 RepID=UPI002076EA0E|nr:uncharacterized protein LOC5507112 isoform X2 [Nematostella vectensis]